MGEIVIPAKIRDLQERAPPNGYRCFFHSTGYVLILREKRKAAIGSLNLCATSRKTAYGIGTTVTPHGRSPAFTRPISFSAPKSTTDTSSDVPLAE